MTTRCPRSAASCAVAAPMPLAAPVISTEREVIVGSNPFGVKTMTGIARVVFFWYAL